MGTAREVVERMTTLFDNGDVAGSVEQFAPNATFVNPLLTLNGADEIRSMFEAFAAAFSDLRHDVSSGIEDGEIVALRGNVTGTHTGTLASPMGEIPATGRSVDYPMAVFARVHDRKIVEFTSYWDTARFLTQLGLMPEPATASS